MDKYSKKRNLLGGAWEVTIIPLGEIECSFTVYLPLIDSKTVAETAATIPEHAAENALEHLVEFEIVDALRRRPRN